jgi:ATP-dependent DNA helicase RecG
LLDGKEPPIIRDVGEAVRVVFLIGDFSVPFRTFVEQRMLDGFRLSLEHLLVLQYILRHEDIDLSTAAEICQQTERETKESLRQLVSAGIVESLHRDKVIYWILSAQTIRFLRNGEDGKAVPLGKFQAAQAKVLARLEAQSGGIKAADVRNLTGLNGPDAKYLLRSMRDKNLIKSVGKGPAAIWYLVVDTEGESAQLNSPTKQVGENNEGNTRTSSQPS